VRPIARTICNVTSDNFSEVIDVGDIQVEEKQREKIRLDIIPPKKLDGNYRPFVGRHLIPRNLVRPVTIKFGSDGRPLTIYALSNQNEEYFRLVDFFPPFLKVLEEALDHRFFVKYPNERKQPWFKAAESEMKYWKRGLHELAQLYNEEERQFKVDAFSSHLLRRHLSPSFNGRDLNSSGSKNQGSSLRFLWLRRTTTYRQIDTKENECQSVRRNIFRVMSMYYISIWRSFPIGHLH
jgi:hypothetical protein